MKGKLQTCEYNYRRKRAKDLLRGKKKRTRQERLLTVEETERMTAFLLMEDKTWQEQ